MLFVGIEPILLLLTCLSHDFRSVLNCLASYHWTIHNTIVFRNTHGLEPYLRLWRYANHLTPYAFFFGFVFKPYLTQPIKLSYHTSVQSQEPYYYKLRLIYWIDLKKRITLRFDPNYALNRTYPSLMVVADDKSSYSLWSVRDSNPWPDACKAPALANWANAP